MARLSQGYNGAEVEESMKPVILPIEEEIVVDGIPKRVPIKYIAEITKASEMASKGGNGMLKLSLGVYYQDRRVYFDDFLSYVKAAQFRIGGLMQILGIDPKVADTDDFLGKFVKITISHEEYEGQTRNRVARYVEKPTPEEITAVAGPTGDTPF